MKILKIITFLSLFFFAAASSRLYAEVRHPEIRFSQTLRIDDRRPKQDLYIQKLDMPFYFSFDNEPAFWLTPYFENRYNFKTQHPQRKTLGLSAGKLAGENIFVWTSLQHSWYKEDLRYYADLEKQARFEAVAGFRMQSEFYPINSRLRIIGYVNNDFIFSLEQGEGVFNEVSAGIIVPINQSLESRFNWLHIDRIHHFDSDAFEASLTLKF